ncbi:hypothetical protein ACF0H5_000268 [Mactra antiquata]
MKLKLMNINNNNKLMAYGRCLIDDKRDFGFADRNALTTMQVQPIKCVVVGDGNVGKTSLLMSYTQNAFPGEYIPTIFDNYQANVIASGNIYSLTLWDTAGQEEYDRLRPLSYPQTDVFLVCFSLTERNSFGNVSQKWLPEIKYHTSLVPIILVGTKEDLRSLCMNKKSESGRRKVWISTNEGINLAQQCGAFRYIECSSKTQRGVKSVFDAAVMSVMTSDKPKRPRKRSCRII